MTRPFAFGSTPVVTQAGEAPQLFYASLVRVLPDYPRPLQQKSGASAVRQQL